MQYVAGRHFQANVTWNEWSMIAKTVAELHAVKLPDDMLLDARNDRFQLVKGMLMLYNTIGVDFLLYYTYNVLMLWQVKPFYHQFHREN